MGWHFSSSRLGSQPPTSSPWPPKPGSTQLCPLACPSDLSRLVLETHPEALFTFPSWAYSSSHPLPLQLHSRAQPLLFLGTPCPPGGTFLSFRHMCIQK